VKYAFAVAVVGMGLAGCTFGNIPAPVLPAGFHSTIEAGGRLVHLTLDGPHPMVDYNREVVLRYRLVVNNDTVYWPDGFFRISAIDFCDVGDGSSCSQWIRRWEHRGDLAPFGVGWNGHSFGAQTAREVSSRLGQCIDMGIALDRVADTRFEGGTILGYKGKWPGNVQSGRNIWAIGNSWSEHSTGHEGVGQFNEFGLHTTHADILKDPIATNIIEHAAWAASGENRCGY
jgi:hypothetical protein